MPRLPIPSDTDEFTNETRAAVRHIRETRKSMPPPSSYLAYAGWAGSLLSDLVDHLRNRTCGDRTGDLHGGPRGQRRLYLGCARAARLASGYA
jgi:hypothetical protein